MTDNEIIALIEKFHANNLFEEEALAFFRWYNTVEKSEFDRLLAMSAIASLSLPAADDHTHRFMQKLSQRAVEEGDAENAGGRLVRFNKRWWMAAAVFLLVATGGVLAWLQWKPQSIHSSVPHISSAPLPGNNEATLTLADGSSIMLDQAGAGDLATQGNVKIIKLDSGSLAYKGTAKDDAGFNTLTTPRGGQFQITLSDGTKVWLNAASSIQYPAAFTRNTRTVHLTGEAYFEVAKNSQQPFEVKTDKMNVRVLGTAFNIMAYNDEAETRTTLVNGAVNTVSGTSVIPLAPGQQAVTAISGRISKAMHPNMESVLAWKNGEFRFDGANITTIMRQVARWYDVEIVYEGKMPANEFYGVVSRKEDVQQLLDGLEIPGNVHFKTEGRIITVMAGPASKK